MTVENDEEPYRSPLSIADQMVYSTVKISCYRDAKKVSTGTGFFYKINLDEDQFSLVVVTNKHVIEGIDQLEFDVHIAESARRYKDSGRTETLTAYIDRDVVLDHPDENVDLCLIPLGPLSDIADKIGGPLFYSMMSESIIPTAEEWEAFDAIETVTMVGCPNGLYDGHNKMPLVRQGVTATSLYRDFDGRPEFMVDMACFPGSSGSPIFVHNTIGYFDRYSREVQVGKERIFFVGILYAGPQIDNRGVITMGVKERFSVQTMMHLGQAIRSNELSKLDDLVRQRVRDTRKDSP